MTYPTVSAPTFTVRILVVPKEPAALQLGVCKLREIRRPFAMRGGKLHNREQKEANNPCGLIARVSTSR